MTPPRVHLRALGCRLNEAELECWARDFSARGYVISTRPEAADLIVVNTCAVTAEAVRKSRQLLRRSQRDNPHARLVVSGCDATLAPAQLTAAGGIDLLVGNTDKDRLPELVTRALMPGVMPGAVHAPAAAPLYARGRSRAFVKVQDGCRHRCTFCIVTIARGTERSRAIAGIVAEVNRLVASGVREVVLTGVHVGGYGADLGTSLAALLGAILTGTDVDRLRLASVEPWDLPARFFELFADPRLMPHLHLPLQSGCDATLRRMGRRCRRQDYARLVDAARAVVAGFNVTTDVIVGFPGETDCEWRQSLEFIERIGFGRVHIFPYSARAGTAAATFPDPVGAASRRDRVRALHELAARMQREYLRACVGCELAVLWERGAAGSADGLVRYHGYTPAYLRCVVDAPADLALRNTIRRAHARAVTPDGTALRVELTC